MAKNSHAPEMTTHITAEHAKGNIFEKNREAAGNPKVEGCYANAKKPSRQEKM